MQVKQYKQQTTAPKISGGVQVPMSAAQTEQRINPNQVGFGYLGAIEAAEATAETMGQLSRAGEQMFNLGARVDDWDQTAKYNKARAEASNALLEYADGLNDRQDYQNFETDLAKQAGELKQRLAEPLHGPYAQRFGLEFDNDVIHAQVKARTAQRAKAADNAVAAEAEARQADMNMIGRPGMSSDERDRIQRRHLERVETMHAQGLITATQAKELVLTFDAFRSEVELKEIIDANPAGGLAMLKGPKGKAAELLADIPANRLDDLVDYAEKVQKAAIAASQKQAEDRAYTAIKRHIGDDLDKQLTALSSPDTIQKLGLDLRQAQYLKSVLKGEAAEADAAKEKQRTALREQESERLQMILEDGDRKGGMDFLRHSEAWTEAEKAKITAGIEKARWATDPAVEAGVIRAINTGRLKSKADLLPLLGNGLSNDDYKKYADMVVKQAGSADEKAKGLNYYEMAVKEFDHYGDDNEWKAKKNDFIITLDWLMKNDGLKPGDPKVHTLAKSLLREIDNSWWSGGDKPAFEMIADLEPWNNPGSYKDGMFGVDAGMPGGTESEIKRAHILLQRSGLAATPTNKMLALKAVQQKVLIEDITPHWPEPIQKLSDDKYGPRVVLLAVQELERHNQLVTGHNVEAVAEMLINEGMVK